MQKARATKPIRWAGLAAAAVAGLAGLQSAVAESYLWTGGGNDLNWETSTNWSPGGIPDSTADDITFDGSVDITSAVSLGVDPKTIGAIYATGGAVNVTIGSAGQQLSLAADGVISRTGGSAWLLINADLNLLGNATFNAQNGNFTMLDGSIAGSGNINVTGDVFSYVYIRGNNAGYSGQITLQSGNMVVTSQAGFGSNTKTILAGGRLIMGGGNVTQDFDVTEDSAFINTGSGGNYTGTFDVAAGKTLLLSTGGGNPTNYPMVFTGQGNIQLNHNPTWPPVSISGTTANTNTGTFTVLGGGVVLTKSDGVDAIAGLLAVDSTGSVIWGQNNQINDNAQVRLNGGTLRPSGFTESAGGLQLSATSVIDFGDTGSSVLSFGDSSSLSWDGVAKLNLTNWGIDAADTLSFGSATGLTAGQLSQVRFINPFGFAAGTYTALINEFGVLTPGGLVISSSTWTADADGDWDTGSNWSDGVPNIADASVVFGGAITAGRTVTLTTAVTVKDIVFNNANPYTIAGTETLTVAGANGISVTSGSHQISAPVKLLSNATFNLSAGTGLTLGNIDAGGNPLVLAGDGTFVAGDVTNAGLIHVTSNTGVTLGNITNSQGYAVGDGLGGGGGNNIVGNITGGPQVTVNGPNPSAVNIVGDISDINGIVTLRGGGSITTGNITNVLGLNIFEDGDRTVGNVTNTNGAAINTSGAGARNFGVITNTGAITFNTISSGSIAGLANVPSLTLNNSTVTLGGNNTSFSGTITVGAGSTLKVASGAAFGTNTAQNALTVFGANGTPATLDFTDASSAVTVDTPISYRYIRIVADTDITFNGALFAPSGANNTTIEVQNPGNLTTFANFAPGTAADSSSTFLLRGVGDVLVTGNLVNTGNKFWDIGNGSVNNAPGTYSGTVEFRPSVGNTVAANFVAGSAGNVGGVNNNITIAVGNSNAFVPGPNNVMILNGGITIKSVNSDNTISRSDARASSITFAGEYDLDFTAAGGLRTLGATGDTSRVWNITTTGGARIRANGIGTSGTANTLLTYQGAASGIFEVYGNSNYAGATTINDILFLANNPTGSATSGGAVTVGATATLGGTGRVGNGGSEITINGVVAPGDLTGTGTLELAGPVTFNSGARLSVQLGGGTPGDNAGAGNYDQLNITGSAVTLDSGVELDFTLLAGTNINIGDVFYILTRSDGGSFGDQAFDGLPEGTQIHFGMSVAVITYQANWTGTQEGSSFTGGNDVALLVTVPEPAGLALVGLGAAGLLARRRRNRARTER